MTLPRALRAASVAGALLSQLGAHPASASPGGAHASAAGTSRWWRLECGEAGSGRNGEPAACTLTVKLRGMIDGSRLQLMRHALERRDAVERALRREVKIHVDVDSQGGEIFSTLEIGRILREQGASIAVGRGASCISSCVFLLMGAIERDISGDARLGIHRPSLGASREAGPKQASEDAIVAAMAEQLAVYAQQMNVPRRIVDDMLRVPPDRIELLSASELARYGIPAVDPVARDERRSGSRSPEYPEATQRR
jgi:ATP-dependent protease ClpP protease subunit